MKHYNIIERYFKLFSNKDDIFAVFDDRQKVVDMWRNNGLNVFQVADGNF